MKLLIRKRYGVRLERRRVRRRKGWMGLLRGSLIREGNLGGMVQKYF